MANYYVTYQDDRNERVEVVIHFEVPAGSNDGGRTWKSIVAELREFEGNQGTSRVPWLNDPATPAAINSLDAGDLYELSFSFQDDAKLSTAQRAANLDTAVLAEISRFTTDFNRRLRFYGTERTV